MNNMRHLYILSGVLLLLFGCVSSKSSKSPVGKPEIVNVSKPVDVVQSATPASEPSSLLVFVCLILAVICTVVLTMIFSYIKRPKPATQASNTVTPIYANKHVATREQRDVIRG